jgi:hypothetical protein
MRKYYIAELRKQPPLSLGETMAHYFRPTGRTKQNLQNHPVRPTAVTRSMQSRPTDRPTDMSFDCLVSVRLVRVLVGLTENNETRGFTRTIGS